MRLGGIKTYENRLAKLEREKLFLAEKLQKNGKSSHGFDDFPRSIADLTSAFSSFGPSPSKYAPDKAKIKVR